jgi:hypothetical protein
LVVTKEEVKKEMQRNKIKTKHFIVVKEPNIKIRTWLL